MSRPIPYSCTPKTRLLEGAIYLQTSDMTRIRTRNLGVARLISDDRLAESEKRQTRISLIRKLVDNPVDLRILRGPSPPHSIFNA